MAGEGSTRWRRRGERGRDQETTRRRHVVRERVSAKLIDELAKGKKMASILRESLGSRFPLETLERYSGILSPLMQRMPQMKSADAGFEQMNEEIRRRAEGLARGPCHPW